MLESLLLNGKTEYKLKVTRTDGRLMYELKSDYIEDITVNAMDHNKMTLKIPKYVSVIDGDNGVKTVLNQHYNIKEKWLIEVYMTDGKNSVENKLKFYISSISKKQDGKNDVYKNVTCYGLSKLLTKPSMFLTTGKTRKLVSVDDETDIGEGMMDLILDKVKTSGWTLGHVDDSVRWDNIGDSNVLKYRWFDAGEYKIYSLMRDTLQQAYNCIFIFDDYNKTINIYNETEFGENKGFVLEEGKLMTSIDMSTSDDDIITILHARGKDNLSITSYNPLGTDYVEDYSYYMNNGSMSKELVEGLNKYYKVVEVLNEQWKVLRDSLTEKNTQATKLNSEITDAEYAMRESKILMTSFMEKNSDQNEVKKYKDELEERTAVFNDLNKQLNDLRKEIESITNQMMEISTKMNKEYVEDENGKKIFTAAMLEELSYFQEESTFEADNYTTPITLYNAVKKEIVELAKPTITTSINVVDFLDCIVPPRGFNYWMKIGDYVTTKSDLGTEKYRLTSFSHKPGTSLSLTLSSKMVLEDKAKSTVKSVTATVSGHNNTIKTYSDVWEDAILTTDFVTKMREDCLDLTASKIRSKVTTNNFQIDETGQWVIDADDEDCQTYIGSNCIAITTNGWDSCDVAITPEGVNARVLIAEAILSNKFYITSEDARITIKDKGMSIMDANGTVRVFLGIDENNQSVLRLTSPDGLTAYLTEKGVQNNINIIDHDNVDAGHPIATPFTIPDAMEEIRTAPLNIRLNPWRSYCRVTSGGGNTVVASSSTTSNGGATVVSSSTVSGGGSTQTSYDTIVVYLAGGKYDGVTSTPLNNFNPSGSASEYAGHTHGVLTENHTHHVDIPAHSHGFSVDIPDHSHSFSTDVNIPSHTHELEQGIFTDANYVPTDCQLWVNHRLVLSGFGYNLVNYDIKDYLTTGNNLIEVTSKTLGRIDLDLCVTGFLKW